MGIFGSKAVVWVPENEKLKEECSDAESWEAKERWARAELLRSGHARRRPACKQDK